MKKQHKLLSLFLALAMVLTFMPAMAFAGEPAPEPEPTPTSPYATATFTDLNKDFDGNTISEQGLEVVITPKVVTNESINQGGGLKLAFTAFLPGGKTTDDLISGTLEERVYNVNASADKSSYTGNIGITTSDIVANLTSEDNNKKGFIEKHFTISGRQESVESVTYTFIIDVRNAQVFKNNSHDVNDPYNLALYSVDGELSYTTKTVSGKEYNKDAWCLMKSEAVLSQFDAEFKACEKAAKAAADSKKAAEEAAKTPGDAAVAAAKKALEDQQKLEKAMDALKEALQTGDIDPDYLSDYYYAASEGGDAEAAIYSMLEEKGAAESGTSDDAFESVEKAITDAKVFLADTKAEAAEAKANDAAAQTAALKYTPEKTKITGVKKAKKKATVSFKKVKKNVTGYELRIKNKKNGKVKIVKVKQGKKNTVKKTIKGLKKNTKYSVKVRAYKKANGKTYYAKWSKAKSFKTLKK